MRAKKYWTTEESPRLQWQKHSSSGKCHLVCYRSGFSKTNWWDADLNARILGYVLSGTLPGKERRNRIEQMEKLNCWYNWDRSLRQSHGYSETGRVLRGNILNRQKGWQLHTPAWTNHCMWATPREEVWPWPRLFPIAGRDSAKSLWVPTF